MAKRFGRNQKRRLQNQIKELTDISASFSNAITERDALLRLSSSQIKELQDTIALTAEVLGPHFVSLPVKTSTLFQRDREMPDVISYCDQDIRSYAHSSSLDPMRPMRELREKLTYLRPHSFSGEYENLRLMVHMSYVTPVGDVRYSISDQAWENLPNAVLEKLITQDLIPKMARKIVELRNQRNNKRITG